MAVQAGVMVDHLRKLKDGRFQYRRTWPEDVRPYVERKKREEKKTFPAGTPKSTAIQWALAQDRKADALIAKVRSGAASIENTERATEHVARWFTERQDQLDNAVVTYWAEDDSGRLVEVADTERDFLTDRIVEAARKREGEGPDGDPKAFTVTESLKLTALKTDRPPKVRMTISRAVDFYVERRLGGSIDKATEAARDQALAHFGDIPLERITRAMASDWTHVLHTSRQQSAATIKKRVGSMKAVINFAKDQGRHTGDNPFARLNPPKSAGAPNRRMPFHKVHLAAIAEHLSGPLVRQETREIVQLLQYTGCRPSEIAGLTAEDLNLSANIPYAHVRWTPEKRTKTEQSQRRVPLVGPALEAARSAARRRPEGWLFPTLAPKSGDANDNPRMSARVNRLIRRAGVHQTPRLVVYSFRHTMAEALDRAGVGSVVRNRVLGKQKTDDYGAYGLPLEDALGALEAALPLLGQVDKDEFSKDELTIGDRDK